MKYYEIQLLICFVPFSLGFYGMIRTRLWRRKLFWLYFMIFPILAMAGASLPQEELRFWGGTSIALGQLLIANMVLFLVWRPKAFSFEELSSMFLFFPLIDHFWGRYGGYLLYGW